MVTMLVQGGTRKAMVGCKIEALLGSVILDFTEEFLRT
jgi:hypothetical protein